MATNPKDTVTEQEVPIQEDDSLRNEYGPGWNEIEFPSCDWVDQVLEEVLRRLAFPPHCCQA